MKTLRIPHQYDQLISYAGDVIEGLNQHGSQLGLQQHTAASLTALAGAAKSAEQAFQGSRAIPGETLTPAQNKADAEARKFILAAKKVLGEKLGDQWSSAWAEAGFVNGSLAVPGTLGERESLLLTISQYLVSHPAAESTDLDVTAARASQLHNALRAARGARKSHTVAHKTKKAERNTAVGALRKSLSWTISDLKRVLAAGDPRWHSFGLVVRNTSAAASEAEPAAVDETAFGQPPVLLPDPVNEESDETEGIAEAA